MQILVEASAHLSLLKDTFSPASQDSSGDHRRAESDAKRTMFRRQTQAVTTTAQCRCVQARQQPDANSVCRCVQARQQWMQTQFARSNSLRAAPVCSPQRRAGVYLFGIDESCAPLVVAWILPFYPSFLRFRVLGSRLTTHDPHDGTARARYGDDARKVIQVSILFPARFVFGRALGTGGGFCSPRNEPGHGRALPCTRQRG